MGLRTEHAAVLVGSAPALGRQVGRIVSAVCARTRRTPTALKTVRRCAFNCRSVEMFPYGTSNVRIGSDHYQWKNVTSCIHNVRSAA